MPRILPPVSDSGGADVHRVPPGRDAGTTDGGAAEKKLRQLVETAFGNDGKGE